MMSTINSHEGGSVKRSAFDVDPGDLRLSMRLWATGVTIVSTRYREIRHGMTVSAFTSVSLDPPLLLVCLEHGTRTHNLVQQSGVYGVSILGAQQKEISERFAGRQTEYQDRFRGLRIFTLKTGSPLILDGLAGLDCRVASSYEAGSHTIFVGEVVGSQIGEKGQPLIYYDRNYHLLQS
jgi:flavin reductase (DIM6/NTAB) family NADH-FMN oxidoreductase RutF